MGFFKRVKKDPKLCPNCRKVVAEETVFCDSCGLRLIPPPTCSKCHLPLAPETNFCETCGTPVGPATPPYPDLSVLEEKTPTVQKKERSVRAKKSKKKKSLPPHNDGLSDPFLTGIEKNVPEKVQSDTALEEIPKEQNDRKASNIPLDIKPEARKFYQGNGVPRKTLIISCTFIFILILALTFMTGLLNNSNISFKDGISPPDSRSHPQVSPRPTSVETFNVSRDNTTAAPLYIPDTTQSPPESLRVWFQAERDPITHIVTVLFDGGNGQRGVREVLVRLTRSDGDVLTQTFKPTATGEGVSLPGTKYIDRLEVIVNYYNGDQYKVIDKVFDYKIRN
jgi:hypothetical protein